jgi:hypothetical protein
VEKVEGLHNWCPTRYDIFVVNEIFFGGDARLASRDTVGDS